VVLDPRVPQTVFLRKYSREKIIEVCRMNPYRLEVKTKIGVFKEYLSPKFGKV